MLNITNNDQDCGGIRPTSHTGRNIQVCDMNHLCWGIDKQKPWVLWNQQHFIPPNHKILETLKRFGWPSSTIYVCCGAISEYFFRETIGAWISENFNFCIANAFSTRFGLLSFVYYAYWRFGWKEMSTFFCFLLNIYNEIA